MYSQFPKIYVGATRIKSIKQGAAAVWDEATGPAPTAPFWSTQPSISPASGAIGTVFTLSEGVAGGTTPLTSTARLLLGATDITDQISVGMGGVLTYTSTAVGQLDWRAAVTGVGGGPVWSIPALAEVQTPPAPKPWIISGSDILQTPDGPTVIWTVIGSTVSQIEV